MLRCYAIASQFLETRFNYYSSQADTGGTPSDACEETGTCNSRTETKDRARRRTRLLIMISLSLRSRLLLAFATVMLILSAAVVIAMLRLSHFNSEVHALTNDRLPKLETPQKRGGRLLESPRHTRNRSIFADTPQIKRH